MLRGLAAGTGCLLRMQTAAQRMHGRLLPAHPQPVIGIPCPLLFDHPVKQTLFHDIPHFRRLSFYHRTAGDAHVLPFAKCSFRKAIRFWMLSCVIELFCTMS